MIEQFTDWRGTAAQLGELAARIRRDVHVDDQEVSERLVRFYVQSGVLDRPEREGREALFGYRQLLQLLVARGLAADGWPLAKIAEYNRHADLKALTDLVPRRVTRPGPDDGEYLADHQPNLLEKSTEKFKAPAVMAMALPVMAAQRSDFGKESGALPSRTLRELVLTPWCRVLVEEDRLQALTAEIAARLVTTFSSALRSTMTQRHAQDIKE